MALPNNPTPNEVVKEIKSLDTNKIDKSNPTGTGSISVNRKENTTIGDYSVALGYNNTASANFSVALGYNCNATAQSSHAEGANSSANGNYSHAEGMTGWANGEASHAEGRQTKALGDYSHAEGYWTTAQRKSQHTFGEYNILDSTGTTTTRGSYVEIVGNGDSNTRSNARTLDWSGNEWLAGKITPAGGISDGNNANYELQIPNTTSWTADKTIATTDDLSDVVIHDDTVTTASETTFADNYYTKTQIIDLIYPIGSVFITVNNVNPKTYLPNTNWELIEDRFLLGAGSTYTAGATGGEATHTLTIDEMPSHNHSSSYRYRNPGSSGGPFNGVGSGSWFNFVTENNNTGYTGSGQAHNNMPPYLVVYMWKRIPLANS